MDSAAEFYRREAARLKSMAAIGMYSQAAQGSLLEIAKQYEFLAKHHDLLMSHVRDWQVEPEPAPPYSRAS